MRFDVPFFFRRKKLVGISLGPFYRDILALLKSSERSCLLNIGVRFENTRSRLGATGGPPKNAIRPKKYMVLCSQRSVAPAFVAINI